MQTFVFTNRLFYGIIIKTIVGLTLFYQKSEQLLCNRTEILMSKKIIITIARQFGSGGREIGELIAQSLGIPIYDKELITDAAAKSDLNVDALRTSDESVANSLLYTLAMGSNVLGATMHFNDKLFILQSEIIREYAAKGSCVIIGRCADYVLRDEPSLFRIFIYGDLDHRADRIAKRHPEIKSSQVIDSINKTDKRRASYYNFYTGNKWGKFDNYDMAINSSTFGVGETAKIITAAISKLIED